jgi:hypothetical protein
MLNFLDAPAEVDLDGFDIGVAECGGEAPQRRQIPAEQGAQETERSSLVQSIFTQLAADSRLLVPTKWHVLVQRIRAIDPYRTCMQLVCDLERARDIRREYSGGQTVQRVVRLAHHVVLVLKLDDDTNRPKNLFLDNAHVWPRLGKDGRLDPVALRAMSLASEVNLSALLLARVDITHDALSYLPSATVKCPRRRKANVVLDLRDLGTLV